MESLIGNITGLFGRGFLLAGLLPVLVACVAVAAMLTAVIGLNGIVGLVLLRPGDTLVVICAIWLVILFVIAQVLRAVRGSILQFFSGDSLLLKITGLAELFTALAWISTEPSPPNGGRVKRF